MINFGSQIKIFDSHKGIRKGVKYQHMASSNHNYPELIKFRKNPKWFKFGIKRLTHQSIHVCAHESIHNIITHAMVPYSDLASHGYDRLVLQFRKQIKKECPKTWREWRVF